MGGCDYYTTVHTTPSHISPSQKQSVCEAFPDHIWTSIVLDFRGFCDIQNGAFLAIPFGFPPLLATGYDPSFLTGIIHIPLKHSQSSFPKLSS